MADEFDRAQDNEQRDRDLAVAEQLRRGASKPADDCRECGEELEEHRKPYGICVHCKTVEETNERHRMRGGR